MPLHSDPERRPLAPRTLSVMAVNLNMPDRTFQALEHAGMYPVNGIHEAALHTLFVLNRRGATPWRDAAQVAGERLHYLGVTWEANGGDEYSLCDLLQGQGEVGRKRALRGYYRCKERDPLLAGKVYLHFASGRLAPVFEEREYSRWPPAPQAPALPPPATPLAPAPQGTAPAPAAPPTTLDASLAAAAAPAQQPAAAPATPVQRRVALARVTQELIGMLASAQAGDPGRQMFQGMLDQAYAARAEMRAGGQASG